MESLLDKVRRIEQEARERLAEVERSGREQLADIKAAEDAVVDEVRDHAEKQGREIIREQVQKAKAETNNMKQDREQSVKMLHDTADKNAVRAVGKIVELFESEYIA